jgi:hypothetical protein
MMWNHLDLNCFRGIILVDADISCIIDLISHTFITTDIFKSVLEIQFNKKDLRERAYELRAVETNLGQKISYMLIKFDIHNSKQSVALFNKQTVKFNLLNAKFTIFGNTTPRNKIKDNREKSRSSQKTKIIFEYIVIVEVFIYMSTKICIYLQRVK